MKSRLKIIIITILILAVVACGKKGPAISHIVLKSDAQGVILDTKDKKFLTTFAELFYDRDEHPEGGPTFKYLIDITTSKGTVRWQYNDDGNIRNFEIPDSPIYEIKESIKFNRLLGI